MSWIGIALRYSRRVRPSFSLTNRLARSRTVMVHDRNAADIKFLRQFAHRQAGFVADMVQERAAGGVGKSVKHGIHRIIRIGNYVITLLHLGWESTVC